MFIHDPDLVPFNVLPNFNIFKRYECVWYSLVHVVRSED